MNLEKLFNKDVMSLKPYIMFKLKKDMIKFAPQLEAKNRTPISLAIGAPTVQPPRIFIDRLKELLEKKDIHTYSTPIGEMYFREAVSKRMKTRFNVEIDANKEVCSLIGSKEGIANLIRFITTAKKNELDKDVIMIPDPGYASYLRIIECFGAKAYPMPLTHENNYKPDVQEIYNGIIAEGYKPENIKALIVNYPSNPLGISTTKEYIQTIIEFCKKYDILLISDAAYSEIYFDEKEKPFSIFELEGAKDIGVEFHSFSKSYAVTGWRIGWVCGNQDVIQYFEQGKSSVDIGIFKAFQLAGGEILNTYEGDKFIEKNNKEYAQKQKILLEGFKDLGWEIEEKSIPKTTFYLWLPIPPRYKSSIDFCEDVLKTSGIVLVPGCAFGKYGNGYFRLSYTCSDEELKEAIKRLKADSFYF